ncbi:MAG: TrkH family potassium uptake protein [Kofleriaceae bacterium]|nr:TrkH family potassium uptake protein [Kofleriaceae bacterium]
MVLQRGIRIVARDVAALQVVLSVSMLASLLVALLYGEWFTALGLAIAASVSAGLGGLVYWQCRDAGPPRAYHAMAIAGVGWLIGALFGALPFIAVAYITPDDVAQAFVPAGETYRSSLEVFENPLHAVFESMSCYTTTSLTMAVHEPSIGNGLLFYRSAATWLGGAGMIVLSLAIIPRPGSAGGLQLYGAEQSGGKATPSILGTARAIWKIYAGATAVLAVFLAIATFIFVPSHGIARAIFDAINHAMAGMATGGVSTLDNGIADFHSHAMELAHCVPMLVGTLSLPLLYLTVRERDLGVLRKDVQVRTLCVVLFVGASLLILALRSDPAVNDPVREGIFQFVSAVSTTGWQTSNIGGWRDPGILILVWGAMFTGGCAGATVGGIKLIRTYILFRATSWRIKRAFLPPEAVVPFTIGERVVPSREIQREIADAAVFTFLFLVVLAVAMLITASFVGPQFTLADVLFETVSVQSTTGLSTGITDPSMPAVIEITFILQMWIGRLEIFPVIIFLRALFVWHRSHTGRI